MSCTIGFRWRVLHGRELSSESSEMPATRDGVVGKGTGNLLCACGADARTVVVGFIPETPLLDSASCDMSALDECM
jgi:hypothetical protein